MTQRERERETGMYVIVSLSSFRTDELKRQYIGVLCGLGADPSTGESIYHEHDMDLTFDTHITNEDLALVSQCVSVPSIDF